MKFLSFQFKERRYAQTSHDLYCSGCGGFCNLLACVRAGWADTDLSAAGAECAAFHDDMESGRRISRYCALWRQSNRNTNDGVIEPRCSVNRRTLNREVFCQSGHWSSI
jgi:hypothetical protein